MLMIFDRLKVMFNTNFINLKLKKKNLIYFYEQTLNS